MVGRVGFEPTVLFRDAIMSRGPATNTAFGPSFKHCMLKKNLCQPGLRGLIGSAVWVGCMDCLVCLPIPGAGVAGAVDAISTG